MIALAPEVATLYYGSLLNVARCEESSVCAVPPVAR